MFRLAYRQRRRILFTTFLMTLGLFMQIMSEPNFFDFPKTASSTQVLVITGLTYLIVAIIIAMSCAIWIWTFLAWRNMVEIIGVMTFTASAFAVLWPNYPVATPLGGTLPCVLSFAIVMLVYGTALDRFPLSLGLKTTRRFKSPKSPETLWAELVPTPASKDLHWDSLLHSLEADPEEPNVQLATYHHGGSLFEMQRQSFTEFQAPHRASYVFDGDVSEKNKAITGGTFTIELEPLPSKGTRVTLSETFDALLPRQALTMWFDDELGDKTDALRARDRNKVGWSVSARYRKKAAALS